MQMRLTHTFAGAAALLALAGAPATAHAKRDCVADLGPGVALAHLDGSVAVGTVTRPAKGPEDHRDSGKQIDWFACDPAASKPSRIALETTDDGSSAIDSGIEASFLRSFAYSRPLLAYIREEAHPEGSPFLGLSIVSLATGKFAARNVPVIPSSVTRKCGIDIIDVQAVKASSTAVAWVSYCQSAKPHGAGYAAVMARRSGGRTRLLDSGRTVDRGYLSISGTKVEWMHAGAVRTARVR